MKKVVLASLLSLSASALFAQNKDVNALLAEENCKAVEKLKADADKASLDPKKGLKASTWLKKAQVYEDIAITCIKIDSNSAVIAYESYKKALTIEPEGGKSGKDIKAGMTGQKLYSALMQQGANLYNGKNVCGAATAFKFAVEVNPKDTTAMLYTGIAAQQCKDIETAKQHYIKFIEAGGKDAAVFFSLSNLYKLEKNNAKSLETLKKGLALNPNDKDLKGEIVNTNISTGNTDEAVKDLISLVETEGGKTAQNMLNIAILLDNANKKDEALSWYKKVLEVDPTNFDCNFNMGVRFFNEAVEIKKQVDKMDMKTYQKEGKAIEEKVCAKFTEAKPYFERAKSVKPEQEVLDNLTNLANVLEQCAKKK